MFLLKVKKVLSKSRLGRVVIFFYRYLYSLPSLWVKSGLYVFIKNRVVQPTFYDENVFFELLIGQKKSVARFGDGEIQWMFNDAKGYFGQGNDAELAKLLIEVIHSKNDQLLVCVPDFFAEMDGYKWNRILSRNAHLFENYQRWNQVLSSERVYGDALITRAYNGRLDIQHVKNIFDSWDRVFFGRNIVIIEGRDTKFGVGNNLISSASSVKRIIGPSESAFESRLKLLDCARSLYQEDILFLICLGPTATILASQICDDGFQAIDIGHLDVEYEWYSRGCKKKTPVPGRYVNEAGGAPLLEIDEDVLKEYRKQIVCNLGNCM